MDPILNEYMSGGGNSGGVYNPANLQLFSYTHNNPVNMVDPDGEDSIIVAGGTSVDDPNGHDLSAWNFLNSASVRAQTIIHDNPSEPVVVVMYTPSYERRAASEGRSKLHFVNIMNKVSKKYGYKMHYISSSKQLTSFLNSQKKGSINRVEYFGHSNKDVAMLEYSSIEASHSTDYLDESEAAKVKKSIFAKGASFSSYGCNQGEQGGLMEKIHYLYGIKTIGSKTKTNYKYNVGKRWKPRGEYVEYK